MEFNWNPNLYDDKHNFVSKFGEEVVDLLAPKQNEIILDIGCGTGDLTKKISNSCKTVIGIDNSSEMIQEAKNKFPGIDFVVAGANDFNFEYKFNAVFSNAVLHWIPKAEPVIQNINRHLKTGGRFVAEFGGKGCVNKIITALTDVMDSHRFKYPKISDMLYYPSIGEYSQLLEKNGFELNHAILFDRPTELKDGLNGLSDFIEMFFNWLFKDISDTDKSEIIRLTNERLKSELLKGTNWIADSRRIRIMATKTIN